MPTELDASIAAPRYTALRQRLRAGDVPLGTLDLRPLWRGQAFARHQNAPMAIRRARALAAVLDRMALPLRPEECLVGAPAGVLADDLPAGVDVAAYERYRALDAEIGERRFVTNADHCAPHYGRLLVRGLGGLLEDVAASRRAHAEPDRLAFLDGVAITLRAASHLVGRWATACRRAAATTAPRRAQELLAMADDLDAIALAAPRTFRQAVQLIWMVHSIYAVEGRGAMAFGRMDQYLLPLYREALRHEKANAARETLQCLWAKMEEPLIPNPVQNIAIGGQRRDGHDATNPLSYLLLDVTRAIGTPHSNLSARLHGGSPQAFVDACCDLIKTGIGFPALFNDDVLVPALTDLGFPLEEARNYAFVGCIETFLPGRMAPWSDSRVNLLQALDRTVRGGRDGGSGAQAPAGPDTGLPEQALPRFDAFLDAYATQLRHLVRAHVADISARKAALRPEDYPSPFLSALIDDCIGRGRDVNDGGARYGDLHGPCGMGLGSTADALAAIRRLIYERGEVGWGTLRVALDADFGGYEALRQRLLHRAPKYGNGDPYVDDLAAEVVRTFTQEVLRHRTPSGGRYVPLMAANTANIAAGREVGATPDGRHAGQPVSDAASPTFGRDTQGPTAVIESLTRVDYRPVVGGTVVNCRFSPSTLAGPEGTAHLRWLVLTYFRRGGMQLQCNVTGRETLEAARRDPERYADLVVRVSGFSALYVTLPDVVQRDILARTEH